MPHLQPVVIPGGSSLVGQSLGFHAYSLRIDNLSNQWLQEESSLAWIPPYSLGTCLRLYGTAVAIIENLAPTGQVQLAPIAGEYAAGFFSDELRTEVAGVPVRQFTLIQAVSDLTQGPEPALPPVGVTRLWSDASGNVHRLLSSGADATLIDSSNYASYVAGSPLGGDLTGTVSSGHVNVAAGSQIAMQGSAAIVWSDVDLTRWNPAQLRVTGTGGLTIQGPLVVEGSSTLSVGGSIAFNGEFTAQTTVAVAGAPVLDWVVNINGTSYRVALKQ